MWRRHELLDQAWRFVTRQGTNGLMMTTRYYTSFERERYFCNEMMMNDDWENLNLTFLSDLNPIIHEICHDRHNWRSWNFWFSNFLRKQRENLFTS